MIDLHASIKGVRWWRGVKVTYVQHLWSAVYWWCNDVSFEVCCQMADWIDRECNVGWLYHQHPVNVSQQFSYAWSLAHFYNITWNTMAQHSLDTIPCTSDSDSVSKPCGRNLRQFNSWSVYLQYSVKYDQINNAVITVTINTHHSGIKFGTWIWHTTPKAW